MPTIAFEIAAASLPRSAGDPNRPSVLNALPLSFDEIADEGRLWHRDRSRSRVCPGGAAATFRRRGTGTIVREDAAAYIGMRLRLVSWNAYRPSTATVSGPGPATAPNGSAQIGQEAFMNGG